MLPDDLSIAFDTPWLTPEHAARRTELFPAFIHELLGDVYPGLQTFRPSSGPDGGIDLGWRDRHGLGVIECKCVKDDWDNIRTAWHATKKHLLDNLTDGTPRAPQYQPWYDHPITAYHLCTTWHAGKQEQVDTLEADIRATFAILGGRQGLAHLADIAVQVVGWGRLRQSVVRRMARLLRWFAPLLPSSLAVLETTGARGTFADFLVDMPYFSMTEYAVATAADSRWAVDAPILLRRLGDSGDSGLLISGAGGIGKTRLMLEIGRHAAEHGWTVLKSRGQIHREHLERLHRHVAAETGAQVLLLIDYAEEQGEMADLANQLAGLDGLPIRFVANCRSNAYRTRLSTLDGCQHLNLSGDEDARTDQQWQEGFRRWVVGRILDWAGIAASDKALDECADIPVLAVFLAYTKRRRGEQELRTLLGEESLTKWLRRRLRQNRGADVDAALAQVMALLPSPYATLAGQDDFRPLLGWLIEDGWIVERDEDGDSRHHTIHDIIDDRMVVEHVRPLKAAGAAHFVAGLLARADQLDCRASALRSLERVADLPPFDRIDWPAVIEAAAGRNPAAWAPLAGQLLAGALMAPPQAIAVIRRLYPDNGWLAIGDNRTGLSQAVRLTLKRHPALGRQDHAWLSERLAEAVTADPEQDHLLATGLRFDPDRFTQPTLAWLAGHERTLRSHFVMTAWLKAGLPLADIRGHAWNWTLRWGRHKKFSFLFAALAPLESDLMSWAPLVRGWLNAHAASFDAEFVYKSWLDAGGGPDFVRPDLRLWLDRHAAAAEAQFVYAAWLKAGGGPDFVRPDLRLWLDRHATAAEAGFVYAAWLDNGHAFATFGGQLMQWLMRHRRHPDVCYPLKYALRQPALPRALVWEMLRWCQLFIDGPETPSRLHGLLSHAHQHGFEETALRLVESCWQAGSRLHPGPEHVTAWLLLAAQLAQGQPLACPRAQAVFLGWLRHPGYTPANPPVPRNFAQWPGRPLLTRVVACLRQGALSVPADRDHLRRFVALWQALPQRVDDVDRRLLDFLLSHSR